MIGWRTFSTAPPPPDTRFQTERWTGAHLCGVRIAPQRQTCRGLIPLACPAITGETTKSFAWNNAAGGLELR